VGQTTFSRDDWESNASSTIPGICDKRKACYGDREKKSSTLRRKEIKTWQFFSFTLSAAGNSVRESYSETMRQLIEQELRNLATLHDMDRDMDSRV
jgi:hypothetical protein